MYKQCDSINSREVQFFTLQSNRTLCHLLNIEYATVGYVEKRIRLRKAQFTMMQKIISEKKKTVAVSLDSEVEHAPRQTVSFSHIYQFYSITIY